MMIITTQAAAGQTTHGHPDPRTQVGERRSAALGPVAEAFLVGAAAAGSSQARHGELGRTCNALTARPRSVTRWWRHWNRATAFGRWRAEDVRSILTNGHGPTPRPAGDALVVTLPAVPTRSLTDYAIAPNAIAPSGDAS